MVMGIEDTPMTWLAWESMMNQTRTIQLRVPMPTSREGLYDLADVFYELSVKLRDAAKAEWEESFQELYGAQIKRERESHFKLYAVAQKKYKEGTAG